MKTEVKNGANLTNRESWSLSLEVLHLLDGLSVQAVNQVLKGASEMMACHTRHNVRLEEFAPAIQGLSQIVD